MHRLSDDQLVTIVTLMTVRQTDLLEKVRYEELTDREVLEYQDIVAASDLFDVEIMRRQSKPLRLVKGQKDAKKN